MTHNETKAMAEVWRLNDLRNQALAKANKILAESITPEFIQYQALEKWDGVLPTTMLPNGSMPFVNIK